MPRFKPSTCAVGINRIGVWADVVTFVLTVYMSGLRFVDTPFSIECLADGLGSERSRTSTNSPRN